jgi:hypothetical protein
LNAVGFASRQLDAWLNQIGAISGITGNCPLSHPSLRHPRLHHPSLMPGRV